MRSVVRVRGEDRRGRGVVISTSQETPAEITERLYRQGWCWAEAEMDGHAVGWIGRNEDTGRRCWWAEIDS